MTRDAFGDRLLDLAYGELSGREAREVEAHAASCEACRVELARIRETRRLMSALPDEAPDAGGERILLAAARQAAEARTPPRRLAPWLWGATAAAFSLVAVAAVSYRLAMRPGLLERPDSEALLGGPYASPPPPAAPPAEAPSSAEEAVRTRAPEPAPPAAAERAPAVASPRVLRKQAEPRGDERSARAEEGGRGATVEDPPLEAEAGRATAAPPEPSADAEAFDAPSPRSAAAPAEAPAAKRAAPRPAEAASAPSAGAARAEALRDRSALGDAGSLRAEVRTFPGCDGETLRRVERDPEGRLVRYVREGRIGGRRVRIEHVYRPDGALAGATVRDLDASGALLDAAALGLELPARADEAGIDAPPRCGR
jgi:hypothetical protein